MTETPAQLAVAVRDQRNAATTRTAFDLCGIITATGLDRLTDNDLDREQFRNDVSAKISRIEAMTGMAMIDDMIAQRKADLPITQNHGPGSRSHAFCQKRFHMRRAQVIAAFGRHHTTTKQISICAGMTESGVLYILDRMIREGDVYVRKYRKPGSTCVAMNHYTLTAACLTASGDQPAIPTAPGIEGYVAARVGGLDGVGTIP